jgi:hypothetical protein
MHVEKVIQKAFLTLYRPISEYFEKWTVAGGLKWAFELHLGINL